MVMLRIPGLTRLSRTAMAGSQARGAESSAWQLSKHSETTANLVRVVLFVVRLDRVATDVVLTLFSPVALAPGSSSAAVAQVAPLSEAAVGRMVASFHIHDWGLFQ